MSEHAHDSNAIREWHVHTHVASVKFYIGILAGLVALTMLTVAVSFVHLGSLNLAVAIVIASIKATLVVLFFMHLRYDNRFNAVILICAVLFIGVFFAYTLNDTDRRGQVDTANGTTVLPSSGAVAPGGMPASTSPAKTETHGE